MHGRLPWRARHVIEMTDRVFASLSILCKQWIAVDRVKIDSKRWIEQVKGAILRFPLFANAARKCDGNRGVIQPHPGVAQRAKDVRRTFDALCFACVEDDTQRADNVYTEHARGRALSTVVQHCGCAGQHRLRKDGRLARTKSHSTTRRSIG